MPNCFVGKCIETLSNFLLPGVSYLFDGVTGNNTLCSCFV